jgi:hypothetical protein
LIERFLETLQRIPIKIPRGFNNQVAAAVGRFKDLTGSKKKKPKRTNILGLGLVCVCVGTKQNM